MALAACLWLVGCATPPSHPPVTAQPEIFDKPPVEPPPYRITTRDTLSVTAYRRSDMSQLFELNPLAVMPDGRISVPLVGDVKATGCTPRELADQLTTGLRESLLNPVINVTVIDAARPKVYVLGEVRSPGVFRLEADLTAIEILAMAGGPTTEGDLARIIVLRSTATAADDKAPMAPGNIDIEALLRHADVRQNLTLRGGDIVYVPPDYISRANRLFSHIATVLAPFAQIAGTATQAVIISLVRK